MTFDKQTIALISIVGSSLDVLGALYLAYDLLGGEHGPLRTLTRAVTYGLLFGCGYGLALGPMFGLAAGVTHGITLAWELSRASKGQLKPGFWYDTAMSGIRGLGFGLGTAWLYGGMFGLIFGVLSTVGQAALYRLGIRPTADYRPAMHPRLTRMQVLAGLNRAAGYAASGYLIALVIRHPDAVSIGVRLGLTIGAVTVISGTCTPLIEWGADHVPEKRMGVIGVGLIIVGFSLQSVQYWMALAG